MADAPIDPDSYLSSLDKPAVDPDSYLSDLDGPLKVEAGQNARNILSEFSSGRGVDLTPEKQQQLVQIAEGGKGAWKRAGNWVWNTEKLAFNPIEQAKLAYGVGKEAAGGAAKLAQEEIEPAKQLVTGHPAQSIDALRQLYANVGGGAVSGLAKLAPVAVGGAQEIADLAGEPFGASVSPEKKAALYQFQRDLNQTISGTAGKLGMQPESGAFQTGELASMAAIPGGAEKSVAPLTAKAAEMTVEGGTKIAGAALRGTAKTAQTIGPAALAAAELHGGHEFAALATLAAGYSPYKWGYIGAIKHAIMDEGIGAVDTLGKAMVGAPNGQTVLGHFADQLSPEIEKANARIIDMKLKAKPEDIDKLNAVASDGMPLYPSDHPELSKTAKNIRSEEDLVGELKTKQERLNKYADVNKVISDAAKLGIQSTLNLGVAGTTGAAFMGSTAPPGDTEAAKTGIGMGVLLGTLGLRQANRAGTDAINSSALIRSGKEAVDPAQVAGLPQDLQDSIHKFAGMLKPTGGKVVVLTPEQMIKESGASVPSEKGQTSSAGYFDPNTNTVYVNSEQPWAIGHESTHAISQALDFNSQKFAQDVLARSTYPSAKSAIDKFQKNYEERAKLDDPNFQNLTPEQVRDESLAELGRMIFQKMPPETFYGGKSGGKILSDWIGRATDYFKKSKGDTQIKTVPGFDAPYTEADKKALEEQFYKVGAAAKSGKTITATPEDVQSVLDGLKTAPETKGGVKTAETDQNASTGFTDRPAAISALGSLGESPENAAPKVDAAIADIQREGGDLTLENVVKRAAGRMAPQNEKKSLSKSSVEKPSEGEPYEQPKVFTKPARPSPEEIKAAIERQQGKAKEIHQGIQEGKIAGPNDLPEDAYRAFMPSSHPDAIVSPAIKVDDMIFRGKNYGEARHAAISYGIPEENIGKSREGFVSKKGTFREQSARSDEALNHAIEIGQVPENQSTLSPEDLQKNKQFMPAIKLKATDTGMNPEDERLGRNLWLSPDGKFYNARDHRQWARDRVVLSPEETAPMEKNPFRSGGMREAVGWQENALKDAGWIRISREREGGSRPAYFLEGNQATSKQASALDFFKRDRNDAELIISGGLDRERFRQFMPSTVNIGLHTNDGKGITPEDAVAALKKAGVNVTKQSVNHSGAEPTLVASLSRPLTPEEAHQVSSDLNQEAIAQKVGDKGELYGPGADKWKPFDSKYFLGHAEPTGIKDALAEIMRRNAPSFMPSSHPDAIKYAAIKTPDGKIWKGLIHADAEDKMSKYYLRYGNQDEFRDWILGQKFDLGFTTNNGEFLDREQGLQRALEKKQMSQNDVDRMQAQQSRAGQPTGGLEANSLQRAQIPKKSMADQYMPSEKQVFTADQLDAKDEGDGWTVKAPNGMSTFVSKVSAKTPEEAKNWMLSNYLPHIKPSQFMPSSRPGALKRTAIKAEDGKIFTGQNLADPHFNIEDLHQKELGNNYEYGWIDNKGKFLGRHLAHDRAVKIGQVEFEPENEGEIHAADMQYMPSTKPFYSQLERTIESQPEKASSEQLRAAIMKGSKQAERSGVKDTLGTSFEDWIKQNPKASKNEMLDFVRENQVQVKEVEKGDSSVQQRIKELGQIPPRERTQEQTDEYRSLSQEEHLGEVGDATKFHGYQLPGSIPGSYRETLATLPDTKKESRNYEIGPIDPEEQPNLIKAGITHQIVNPESGAPYASGTLAEMEKKLPAMKSVNVPNVLFESFHWDEPNVVLHLRSNERELPDDGKMFFLEELQSDWAQKGRKQGYGTSPDEFRAEQFGNRGMWAVKNRNGDLFDSPIKTQEEAQRLADQRNTEQRTMGVPDMPFKSNWKTLGLKIALRKAVESGAKELGWTTGEQQAERYDLSKQLDTVVYNPRSHDLEGYAKGGSENDEPVINVNVPPDKLPDHIGKEAAEKIVNGTPNEKDGLIYLSNQDLKVGGAGMKGFYDRELVNLANDLVKKWGVRVGKTEIKTTPEEFLDAGPEDQNFSTVHSLPITDAMRKDILEKGQPMFAPSITKLNSVSIPSTSGVDGVHVRAIIPKDDKKKKRKLSEIDITK